MKDLLIKAVEKIEGPINRIDFDYEIKGDLIICGYSVDGCSCDQAFNVSDFI